MRRMISGVAPVTAIAMELAFVAGVWLPVGKVFDRHEFSERALLWELPHGSGGRGSRGQLR